MKIYVVIDTNVLVSAMLSKHDDSSTVQVVKKLFSKRITPLYNSEILAEYTEVLRRPKFHLPESLVTKIIDGIEVSGINAERKHSSEYFVDTKDIVFYEVALSQEGAFLVTGNIKHFPNKPIVVSPAEFLEILNDHGK